eukprot:4001265-Pyramimonas_sp.AAC.1
MTVEASDDEPLETEEGAGIDVGMEVEEEPEEVGKYFDSKMKQGIRLMSNGIEEVSESFQRGIGGFIQVIFKDDSTLTTEFPNSFLDDDGAI